MNWKDEKNLRLNLPTAQKRVMRKKALSYGVWHMQNTGIGSTGDFNKIHNPRKLPEGKLMHLPPLKEL